MSLSKKEIEELQPIIHETVTKRLGFPEKAVMKASLSCLMDNLDHEGATNNMAALLGDDLAPRFVEDLLNNVNKFRYAFLFQYFLLIYQCNACKYSHRPSF